MQIKHIDQQKCIKCLECIRDCPPGLFHLKKKAERREVVFNDPGERCLACGHCIAICPAGAVVYTTKTQAYTFDNITDPSRLFPLKNLENFLARRRSTRRFKQGDITPHDLSAFFRAMQFAPSAGNARSWQFIAVTDKATIKYLSDETIELFKFFRFFTRLHWLIRPLLPRFLRKMLGNPTVRQSLDQALADYAGGKDIILFGAPCVIIVHAPSYGHIAGNDAGIILTHGMLAAESLGLGSCWIGFLQEAFRLKRKLKQRLGIPNRHKVQGVLALGYPAVQYYHVPPREPLSVRYI